MSTAVPDPDVPDVRQYWIDMLTATTKNALASGLTPQDIQDAVTDALS